MPSAAISRPPSEVWPSSSTWAVWAPSLTVSNPPKLFAAKLTVVWSPNAMSAKSIRLAAELAPQQEATLVFTAADGGQREVALTLRIDTPIEVDYYRHGGILPFVLRQLLAA